jgi:transcription initiation factor TFIIF subunit beta
MTRAPSNQLLDVLFVLIREREEWPIKLLREKTQQPEVYLKEVWSEIVILHRNGEFNGTWGLMPSFKEVHSVANEIIFPCADQGREQVAAVCASNI